MRRRLEVPALEKNEEAGIVELYTAAGCHVYKTSQPRPTMMTAGIPDLFVVAPRKRLAWWHEVKRCQCAGMRKVDTRQKPEQRLFEERVLECGQLYLLGCGCVAEAHLREVGLIV